MKVTSALLQNLHLDKSYSLLTAKNIQILMKMFNLLDIHHTQSMNDVQFWIWMKHLVDLNKKQIYKVFDQFDIDGSGEIDFDEFYLLNTILISIQDKQEKQFIYRHSRTVFDLMDEDGSNTISADEFENLGFLFNVAGDPVKDIFGEFDVSGDQELDYKEFKMFAMACIDRHSDLERRKATKLEEKRRKRLLKEKKHLLSEAKKRRDLLFAVMNKIEPGSADQSNETEST
ncbi:EF-hand calcium-binding domain-containing protein 9-like [Tubulanus polymorphus]|uniref:EF-hand calcium-binding domain-containing protein 9-like n=1 Tax=Tubulanus polymorphus TaxID=672921 RepID=UPI003DA62D33